MMAGYDLSVAKSYGEALFRAAKEAGVLDEVLDQAVMLRTAMKQTPQLRPFLEAPHVPTEEKEQLLRQVFARGVHRLLANFVLMMLKRGRILLFTPAVTHFEELVTRDRGFYAGTVHTAVRLTQGERERLKASLEKSTGRRLTLEWQEDPSVLGGVVFKSGDLLIDNSIASKLKDLRARLMATRII